MRRCASLISREVALLLGESRAGVVGTTWQQRVHQKTLMTSSGSCASGAQPAVAAASRELLASRGKVLLYVACGVALGANLDRLTASTEAASPATDTQPLPPATVPLSGGCLGPYFIADAAAKAAPAVVNVLVQQESGAPVGSSGSGFILDSEGTILTSLHVVADALAHRLPSISNGPAAPTAASTSSHVAAQRRFLPTGSSFQDSSRTITVTLLDGRVFDAALVSGDAVSDLAVLKIKADSPLPTVRIGSSATLRAGEWVVALGSPLHLQNSVTAGIVSCVDRKGVELGLAGARTEFIQSDAAINRGSSGGPLVNLAGEVIGVSCMKAVAADGVSFAIPMDTAKDVVRQLAAHGRVIRPFIGVKLLQLNRHSAGQLRRRDPSFPNVDGGVLVPHVYPGSPAEKAGIRAGDVVVAFGGAGRGSGGAGATTAALIKALGESIGRPLEVRVVRRGEGGGKDVEMTLKVVAQEAE